MHHCSQNTCSRSHHFITPYSHYDTIHTRNCYCDAASLNNAKNGTSGFQHHSHPCNTTCNCMNPKDHERHNMLRDDEQPCFNLDSGSFPSASGLCFLPPEQQIFKSLRAFGPGDSLKPFTRAPWLGHFAHPQYTRFCISQSTFQIRFHARSQLCCMTIDTESVILSFPCSYVS